MTTPLYIAGNNAAIGQFLHLAAVGDGEEFDPAMFETFQECTTALFRNPYAMGAIGVSADIAAHAVREIRMADVKNPLFVLVGAADIGPGRHMKARVQCLMAGADDVQPFPIDIDEYLARLRALRRRDRGMPSEMVQLPNCQYWPLRGVLHGADGRAVSLTRLEAEALNLLIERPHSTVSKEMLMQRLYNDLDEPQIKIIDVFICKVRKKIRAATGGLDVVETIWGRGYAYIPEGFTPEYTNHIKAGVA